MYLSIDTLDTCNYMYSSLRAAGSGVSYLQLVKLVYYSIPKICIVYWCILSNDGKGLSRMLMVGVSVRINTGLI